MSGAFMMWRGMQHLHGTMLATSPSGAPLLPTDGAAGPRGVAVYAKPLLARNAERLSELEAAQTPGPAEAREPWDVGQPLWHLSPHQA